MKQKVLRSDSTETRVGSAALKSSSAQSATASWPSDVLKMKDLYSAFVPSYQSRNYGPRIFVLEWDQGLARRFEAISPKRTDNRINNYIVKDEMTRVSLKLESKGEASIRFGELKSGHGYSGERGDFCLVAGIVTRKELTVYYRSLEMIGGLVYDWTLFYYLACAFDVNWRTVTIVTKKAFVFALRGNSNEKLYPKVRKILYDPFRA